MQNQVHTQTQRNAGLSSHEAAQRLKKYGPNQLDKGKGISAIKIFLSQFNDFMIWVLIGATVVSGMMGEKADAITILIVVIMNGVLGFLQEFKTEKSLEALKRLAAPTVKVVRDGRLQVINAELLVIGDLIHLESGDRAPADCMLVEESGFLVDESLLTGESLGVHKKANANGKVSSVYMGTIVLKGKGQAVVTDTGMKTEMGKIAVMLQEIEVERSPLKEKMASLGTVIVIVCLVICALVTVAGILRGEDKFQMFMLGVSLAVAAIPEGLPAIVTVALALGVSRMLKRNALVRKLPAVETLGCTSIICSDKTGTLTENNMTVKEFFVNNDMNKIDKNKTMQNTLLKKAFTYCNDFDFNMEGENFSKCLFGDPTETALIKAFFTDSKKLSEFQKQAVRLYDRPFDSDRKMMSVIMREGGKQVCYVKGAPERIINRCKFVLINGSVEPFTLLYKDRAVKAIEKISLRALRCIAAAYKEKDIRRDASMEDNLIFIGAAGMIDPPRVQVKDAVLKCKIAGIRPVMITGDHKNTAYAIGKELDFCSSEKQVISGEDIDKLSEKQLIKKVEEVSIFARVSPNHKLRIVKAFKKNNYIVAMTGDGVNDAPAVKEADIGISMGISGTDVTKEASSMILMDDNFTTIVAAVEEGRVIYSNIRKFIRYLLSCNLGEVLTMLLSSAFSMSTPLLPIQILMINLATDGLPAVALGVDPGDKDIMSMQPRAKNESIFARGLKEKIVIRGCLIGVCTILAFLTGKFYGMSLETCRTLALCTLILSQLIHVFECRSETKSLFQINPFTNLYLVGAVMISITMMLCIIYVPFLRTIFHTVPMGFNHWAIVIFFSFTIAFVNSMYLYFK